MTVQPLSPAAASLALGPIPPKRPGSPSKAGRAMQLVRTPAVPAKKRKLDPAAAAPKGRSSVSASSTQRAQPHDICAFCLQRADRPKGDTPKLLISCFECGSSGHPACLRWGRNPIKVRKASSYDWRCIECKKCEICRDKGDDVSLLLPHHVPTRCPVQTCTRLHLATTEPQKLTDLLLSLANS